jgi:hypothetical protein
VLPTLAKGAQGWGTHIVLTGQKKPGVKGRATRPYAVEGAILGAEYGRTPQGIGLVGDFFQGLTPGVPPVSWAALAGEVVSNWSEIKQEFNGR